MFLLNGNKYLSNPEGVVGGVTQILEKVSAEVLASRPWQDGKLAYLVGKHRKGLHYLIYFRLDSQQLNELNRLCRLNEVILRQLIIKLDPALVEPMVAMVKGEAPPDEGDAEAKPEAESEKKPEEKSQAQPEKSAEGVAG
jgi:small subunit ribosomal protein S6